MSKAVCSNCGSRRLRRKALARYPYKESGLENIVLVSGVTRQTCGACGEATIAIAQEWQLLQVLAIALLKKGGKLTGPEMRFLRGACGLTQAELAKLLHVRRPTVAERESKANPNLDPGQDLLLRVVLLKAFQTLLDQEGNNHLNAEHMKSLTVFAGSLVEMAERLFDRGRGKLQFRQLANRWVAEPTMSRAA